MGDAVKINSRRTIFFSFLADLESAIMVCARHYQHEKVRRDRAALPDARMPFFDFRFAIVVLYEKSWVAITIIQDVNTMAIDVESL